MKTSIKKGFGFGITSGIITTLGLIIGLYSTTKSVMIILGGIIIIAIADSLSDALGMHISEETNHRNSRRKIWEATASTFLFKFIFALSFIIPFLIFDLGRAIIANIIWGIVLLSVFSYYIAKSRHQSKAKSIFEHLIIAVAVIIATHYVGQLVNFIFE